MQRLIITYYFYKFLIKKNLQNNYNFKINQNLHIDNNFKKLA